MTKPNKKSTEVALFNSGTDMAVKDYVSELESVSSAELSGEQQYLKFTKRGEWVYGREAEELFPDDVLALNPWSFVVGWQGWEDGRPIDGPVVPATKRSSLPPLSALDQIPPGEMNGWSEYKGVSLKLVDDEISLQYNTTSVGGKKLVAELIRVSAAGMKAHPAHPIPLIKLGGSEYKHSMYGTVATPEYTLIGWADVNGKQNKRLKP